MMTIEGTEGYTPEEISLINAEFEDRWARDEWPTDSRYEAEQWFFDEVSRR